MKESIRSFVNPGITLRASCAIAQGYLGDYSLRCCDNAIAPSCLRRSKRQSLNAEVMRRGQSTIRFRDRLNSLETSGTSILFRDTRTHGLHQISCIWLPFVSEMLSLLHRLENMIKKDDHHSLHHYDQICTHLLPRDRCQRRNLRALPGHPHITTLIRMLWLNAPTTPPTTTHYNHDHTRAD